MRYRTLFPGGVLVLNLGLAGCGGPGASPTPLSSSPLPQQATVPTAARFPPGTLTGVSLSGVVYELTPAGRKPISGALVYCELCGQETHTWATADDNGAYLFSGDLATGGGVWLIPGVATPIAVGGWFNNDFEDPPGLPALFPGPGWRAVQMDGDTRFDVELVRRAAATP
jgi:hypothetical protein